MSNFTSGAGRASMSIYSGSGLNNAPDAVFSLAGTGVLKVAGGYSG